MPNYVIKLGDRFWSGKHWVAEYSNAQVFTDYREACRAAYGKHWNGATVFGDYGLETEWNAADFAAIEKES